MIRLFNSAMMPVPGRYHCVAIPPGQFFQAIEKAWPDVISSIGYQSNLDLIYQRTGIDIPLSRDNSELQDGDIILAMRLKFRVFDPDMKGVLKPGIEDFEFFHITYFKK